MTELIEVDGLNADLEVVEDVVEVIEIAEQGPLGVGGGGSGGELPQPLAATDAPEFADINLTPLAADSFFGNVAKSVLSWINTFTAWLKALLTDAGRDTGFVSQDGVISLPSATELQMTAGQVFYRKGKKTTTTVNEVVTVTNASGNSYIGRAAADGALVSSGTVWTLADYLAGFCSVVITQGYNNHLIALEERHNFGRDIRRHNNDHHGRGAFINPAGFIRTAPSAASPATINLSSGSLFDEDLHTPVAAATTVRRWWRAAGGASLERDTATSLDPRLMNGNLIRWDNNGTLTNGATGKFYPYFIYVSPEKWASSGGTTGLYVVVAQGEYANAAAAKAAPRPTLPGFPTNELVLLYVVPYKQANINSVTLDNADIVDWRSSQLGGSAATGTFSAVASAILLDPITGLAPTSPNVQAGFENVVVKLGEKVDRTTAESLSNKTLTTLKLGYVTSVINSAATFALDLSIPVHMVELRNAVTGLINISVPLNTEATTSVKSKVYLSCWEAVTTLAISGVSLLFNTPTGSFPSRMTSLNVGDVLILDIESWGLYAYISVSLSRDNVEKVSAKDGIATNLKEASSIITGSATTTIDWRLGHVVINNVSLASLTITNVPTDATGFLTIMHLYTTGARSLGWVATNILSAAASYAAAGTSGGFDKYVLQPSGLGDGKFTVSCVESK